MAGPFELALSQFAAKAGANADQAVRRVVLDLQSRIIARTEMPVDTGRLRASFFYGLNTIPTQVPPEVPEGMTIPAPEPFTLAKGTGVGNVHYIVSNLEYALRMEFGFSGEDSLGRTYNQAPHGFVALSVLDFAGIVDKAAKEVAG